MASENQPSDRLLFKMAHAIAAKASVDNGFAQSDEDKRLITAELDALGHDAGKSGALVNVLFPAGLPPFDVIYETLYEVSHWLHFGELAARATGLLWSGIFRLVQPDSQLRFLEEFANLKGHSFFVVLDALPALLRASPIPADFASSWFLAIHERVGKDMACGGLWAGSEAYAEVAPDGALKVVEDYVVGQIHEAKLSIAACLLGVLRTLPSPLYDANQLALLETRYSDHRDLRVRMWYYRSWIYTARRGALSLSDFTLLLERMETGTTEEQDERFNIACRCLQSPTLSADGVAFAIAWLREHAGSDLSHAAKFPIAELHHCRRDRIPSALLAELFVAIQPLAADLLGIWRPIEYFLVEQLKENYGAFTTLFLAMAQKNATGLLGAMQKHQGLDYLLAELKQRDAMTLITELVLSTSEPVRRLGLFLFDELEAQTLSPDYLSTLTDVQLQVALLEMERMAFDGEAIGRFLKMLVPCVEDRGQDLKAAFRAELVTHAKNYPGGCFEQLKQIADKSPLVRQAVEEAERYFANLRKTVNSPVSAMAVEGFERAYVMMQRHVSATISEGVKKYSLLSVLAKELRLVYGMSTAHYHQGHIGESSPLQRFETNFEVARLEEIDPEMMALRRLSASGTLASLKDGATASPANGGSRLHDI